MTQGVDPAAVHPPSERAAYRYMDAMRFAAALAVVLAHLRGMIWLPAAPSMPLELWSRGVTFAAGFPHQAVVIFFVLSGFWISHSANRQLQGAHFWPDFLTDRLSRLLIVLVPALAVGAMLDLAGAVVFDGAFYSGGLGRTGMASGIWQALAPEVLLGNLLFLQSLAVSPWGTNGSLWSLAFEFWYYIWFAALAVSVQRRKLSVALVALGLCLIWPKLLYTFPVWLVGSVVFYADRHWLKGPETSRWRARAILAVGLVALAAALRLPLKPESFQISDFVVALAFALVLWGLLRGAVPFPRWLGSIAGYGAGASFSLYVIHMPLFAFALAVLGFDRRVHPDLASLSLIAALVFLAIAVAWLFARLTEANTARLRRMVKLRLERLRIAARSPA